MRFFALTDPRGAASAYPCATESPRPFWADGLELSREWLAENLGKHVEGFHLEEDGEVIGHIYWAPSERALVPYETEPGVAWLYCEWVQRPHQGKGYMRELFSRGGQVFIFDVGGGLGLGVRDASVSQGAAGGLPGWLI